MAELLAAPGDLELAAAAEAFLLARPPDPDLDVTRVNRVVDLIMADHDLTRVEDAAGRAGHRHPPVQRLFATYVGVTPKWVIWRSRPPRGGRAPFFDHGHQVDLAFLARDLGYFDQAHFAKDFRRRRPLPGRLRQGHATRVVTVGASATGGPLASRLHHRLVDRAPELLGTGGQSMIWKWPRASASRKNPTRPSSHSSPSLAAPPRRRRSRSSMASARSPRTTWPASSTSGEHEGQVVDHQRRQPVGDGQVGAGHRPTAPR